jgi:hypothetical protein
MLFFIDESWQTVGGHEIGALRLETTGHSRLLESADKMLKAIKRHQGKVFLIWTSHSTYSLLNNPHPEELSEPYRQLLLDMRALMRKQSPRTRGALTFDQRHQREDEATACAISNYFFRARGDWDKRFIQVPTFASSAISPGLQAADLVVYLGPHLADHDQRPELAPYIQEIQSLRFEYRRGRQQRLNTSIRRIG